MSITVEEGATWRDVLAALAREVPILVGRAIAEEGHDLLSPYLLNLGGTYFVKNLDEEARLKDGDHLSLLTELC